MIYKVNHSKKLVIVWLQKDEEFTSDMNMLLRKEIKEKHNIEMGTLSDHRKKNEDKYMLVTMKSGTRNILEETKDLLRSNLYRAQ